LLEKTSWPRRADATIGMSAAEGEV
jgi:hypothetical protein